jgi:hypothetical protein
MGNTRGPRLCGMVQTMCEVLQIGSAQGRGRALVPNQVPGLLLYSALLLS